MDTNDSDEKVRMTGGSFANEDTSLVVSTQPKTISRRESEARNKSAFNGPFDDAHCERNWSSGICACGKDERRSGCCYFCCWPYFKYMIATRLGETPFMALIPCAAFALRIKVRTLFGIKGSLVSDFWTTCCCEPCAQYQVANAGISQDEKQQIVDIHNKYRRMIGHNATNMMKVYWDDELANTAQHHAEQCQFAHDELVIRRPSSMPGIYVGQNMCIGSKSWEECVKQFYDEKVNFAYGFGTKTLRWTDIGHFTQLASWHITKVGCGYAECVGRADKTSMVCNYAYGQYQEDIQRPYTAGVKCGECPDHCDNGLCDCGDTICENFGVLDVKTCTCKCLPYYSGKSCEQVTCAIPEHTACSKQTINDCRTGVNIAAVCPKACGRCH
ncbi:CRISP [Mytilus edulis]|uniref:CRISP n=1 Tax=Mytilus edulis TaxID=6550 RepID=A0A8S3QNZ1_MYTED|nr:CRISP [Mytilus edulis]